MNRKLLSYTIFIFLSALFTIEASAQNLELKAVEYERMVFASENVFDANDALVAKADCYMDLGRYEDAYLTLDRVEMYALDALQRQDVLMKKARAAYLSLDYDAAFAVLSEVGYKLPDVECRQLSAALNMILTFTVPAGYIYVGEPLEGAVSTLLNAGSIAWTVSQLCGGLYVSGILGGAILLNATYLGAQQRTAQVLYKKNAAAYRDAQRKILEKYF